MEEKVQRGNSNLAIKAGFWYVVSTFLIKGLSFITTPIFARLMDEKSYGEFSNFASWQATLLIITSAELYNTLAPAYYDHTEDYDGYVSSVTITSCIITAIIYGTFLLCRKWVFNIVSIPEQYVHILFVMLLFQSCKSIFMARERTLYRYKRVAVISTINLLIPTAIAILLVIAAPASQRLSARIYGYYLPSAMIGVYCAAVLLKKGGFRVRLRHCSYALKLSLPLIVHYLTAYLLTSSNTIVTKAVLGAEATATVSIANSTIHILTVFFQAVSGAFTTWVMDNLNQKHWDKLKKDSIFYILLLAVVAGGVMLLGPEVVLILGGRKYAESSLLIPGLVLSVFIQSVTTMYTIILTYDKNVLKTAIYTGVAALISIAVKVMLLPVWGVAVLPYVNIGAFLVMFFVNYWLVCRAGYKKAANFRGFAAVILVMGVLMVLCLLLYRQPMLRYAVTAVFGLIAGIIALRNKKKIMVFLRKLKKA